MSLSNRLGELWDVFSLRRRVHGPGYKPDEISDRLRTRILMLYRDVVTGGLLRSSLIARENHGERFFAEVQHALSIIYGRPALSSNRNVSSPATDAIAFLERCSADELFDFIEVSFKVEVAWPVFHDENEIVDALNNVFRLEDAPYQVTRGIQREEPADLGTAIVRVAYPKVVRVDEEVPHTQAVEPALSVLACAGRSRLRWSQRGASKGP